MELYFLKMLVLATEQLSANKFDRVAVYTV